MILGDADFTIWDEIASYYLTSIQSGSDRINNTGGPELDDTFTPVFAWSAALTPQDLLFEGGKVIAQPMSLAESIYPQYANRLGRSLVVREADAAANGPLNLTGTPMSVAECH